MTNKMKWEKYNELVHKILTNATTSIMSIKKNVDKFTTVEQDHVVSYYELYDIQQYEKTAMQELLATIDFLDKNISYIKVE